MNKTNFKKLDTNITIITKADKVNTLVVIS